MTGLIHFFTDAASNDVAAPPILWVEGQPAGTVNNSMREVMAALAKWRDDNAGGLVASRGAADAYSVATFQIFTGATVALPHTLAFMVSAANQGPATLALDGLTALPLRRPGNVELAPGDLAKDVVYRVVRGSTAYVIVAPAFDRCSAIGLFGLADVPNGWVPCDGRLLSRVSYAALFARIGGTFGAGDGATTFAVPDLRGRAPFGVDAGAGRLSVTGGLAGALGSAGGAETVILSPDQMPSHGHGGSTTGAGGHDHGGATGSGGQHNHGGGTGGAGSHSHSGTTGGGGGHSHTGSTDSAGGHVHPIGYNRSGIFAGSGSNTAVTGIYPSGVNSGGATDSDGTSSGQHTHGVTTSAVGDHQHAFSTDTIANHGHTISADGDHAHGITGVADHTHALNFTATGGGQAHPNMPPGLVVTFAIKA